MPREIPPDSRSSGQKNTSSRDKLSKIALLPSTRHEKDCKPENDTASRPSTRIWGDTESRPYESHSRRVAEAARRKRASAMRKSGSREMPPPPPRVPMQCESLSLGVEKTAFQHHGHRGGKRAKVASAFKRPTWPSENWPPYSRRGECGDGGGGHLRSRRAGEALLQSCLRNTLSAFVVVVGSNLHRLALCLLHSRRNTLDKHGTIAQATTNGESTDSG